jgi:hypothetical protein
LGAIDASIAAAANIPGLEKLLDPEWRLFSGELYKIIIKDENDPDAEGLVLPFKPNRAQRRFVRRMWHRNIILKARQLGFTTLVAILWLDFALFNANVNCGIIAQDDLTAQAIFRSKVKFAYDNLPAPLRALMPLKYCNAHEMEFAHNGSTIRVATSMRGGTLHRLHVSEFGKICAKFPAKAAEVIDGSIPAVAQTGILIIESTAEGQDGPFYKLTMAAIKKMQSGKALSIKDYRFHFYPWWQEEGYRLGPANVVITEQDAEYFFILESKIGITLDAEQRAWYVATRNEFEEAGRGEKMLQEYPSTPEEAFQRSIEGTYYAKEMARMRKERRICRLPILDMPCYTFWDIGGTAGTAVWILQPLSAEKRMIYYKEFHNEAYGPIARWLIGLDLMFEKHFLPHDADHKRQLQEINKSPKEMLEDLMPGQIFEIVPRVQDLEEVGIPIMRKHFPELLIDEERCAEGIKRIDGYKRKFDTKNGTYRGEPEKYDGNSEGADALRQWAQAEEYGLIGRSGGHRMGRRAAPNWKTGR